ncbi:hypothetical protein [Bartonella phoceensis]|uniref:hypothetical protein n=1 Tax=Bartonella phoceensis TaxID=270249 RepID=UPI001FE78937|nr:hypothetical protein [Bartonella phoceensis]
MYCRSWNCQTKFSRRYRWSLASCGKKPFVVSQACFLTTRVLEQIKVDVAYCENPV